MQRTLAATATALALTVMVSVGGSSALAPDPGPEPSQEEKARLAAAPETWPMKIDEFLAKEYLTRSDVVLTRRDYDITSFAIRWATDSPYSHAALVFNRPLEETGITSTFVIEAGSSGVDLTDLREYISDKSSFVAIKRFKKDWFDEELQGRVRGLLLDKIKASYNYWAIGRIARTLWFGVQTATRGKRERAVQAYKDNKWEPPSEFICSGLVQIGFVETVLEAIDAGKLPPSSLRDVVFLQRQRRWLPNERGFRRLGDKAQSTARRFRTQNLAALEAITPEDLAKSDKLEWLYMIKNGLVYQIKSYEEAKALIDGEPITIHKGPAPKPQVSKTQPAPAEPAPAPTPAQQPAASSEPAESASP